MQILFSRFFLLVFLLCFSACIQSKDAVSGEEKQYIVKFKENVSEARKTQVLDKLGLKIKKELSIVEAYTCISKNDKTSSQIIKEGKKMPEIQYIEPDYTVQAE